jgi:hypothetical protein
MMGSRGIMSSDPTREIIGRCESNNRLLVKFDHLRSSLPGTSVSGSSISKAPRMIDPCKYLIADKGLPRAACD